MFSTLGRIVRRAWFLLLAGWVLALVSSRKPDDIPAFNREMIRLFSGARQTAGAAT